MKNHKADPVIKKLSEVLRNEFSNKIEGIILFGSRARGDYSAESDYDVIVLVDHKTKEIRDKISEMAWEIGQSYNMSISIFVYEKSQFDNDKYEPIFMNVKKEGIFV